MLAVVVPRRTPGDGGFYDQAQAVTMAEVTARNIPVFIGADPKHPDGLSDEWSMSRAFNAGAQAAFEAGATRLLLTPADYLIDATLLDNLQLALDAWPWWAPFSGVEQLNQEHVTDLLNGKPIPPRGDITIIRDETNWWPGMWLASTNRGVIVAPNWSATAVRRDAFDLVKGFDPRPNGSGPEDQMFRLKLDIMIGRPLWPTIGFGIELNHERPKPTVEHSDLRNRLEQPIRDAEAAVWRKMRQQIADQPV